MNPQIPSIWREEIWHPLSVHFPVALLLVAALIEIALCFFPRLRKYFPFTVLLLLLVGSIGAWLAVYTGSIAEDVVNRVICDPTVTQEHEFYAKCSAWIFSAASFIKLLQHFGPKSFNQIYLRYLFQSVLILCLLGGSYTLVVAGHLGASLVYQQGAATYQPSTSCSEFE